MNISYISYSLIPSRTANSIHVMKMCQALQQEGHHVTLYAPRPQGMQTYLDDSIWHNYGIVDRFSIQWIEHSQRLKGFDYAWRAVSAAKSNGSDLVYTRFVPAAILARLKSIYTICEIHSPPTGLLGPALFFAFLRGTGSRRVVVISLALRRWLEGVRFINLQDIDVVVAHDGIDIERFTNLDSPADARRELGLNNVFTIVYSGHLYYGRGVDQLLDLAATLPEVEFLFVGGEPKSVEDRRHEVANRCLNNVTFIGFVANAELPRYLAAGDVLAMPYQRQVAVSGNSGNTVEYMSPLKMFEYLAANRLIISSDLPVLREVLSDEVAELCNPDDLELWRTAILSAIDNPILRINKAKMGRQLVEKYSWRVRAKRTLDGISIST